MRVSSDFLDLCRVALDPECQGADYESVRPGRISPKWPLFHHRSVRCVRLRRLYSPPPEPASEPRRRPPEHRGPFLSLRSGALDPEKQDALGSSPSAREDASAGDY